MKRLFQRTTRSLAWLAPVAVSVMLTGCGVSTDSPTNGDAGTGGGGEGTGSAPTGKQDKGEAKVELETIAVADIPKMLKKHEGKVIFIDVWGWACIPCMKAYPKTIDFYNEFKDKDLVVISVATNTEEKDREKSLNFLKKQKSVFENYIINVDEAGELQKMWDFTPIPALVVYNRKGERVQTFNEGADMHEKARKVIEAELEKK